VMHWYALQAGVSPKYLQNTEEPRMDGRKLKQQLTITRQVGFQALRAVTFKCMAMVAIMSCSSGKVRHFGGTYRLHLQG
jgi:hypothetical protein